MIAPAFAAGAFCFWTTGTRHIDLEKTGLIPYVMVMVGAAAGGALRYLIGTLIMARYGGRFPLGTFIINVTGSFGIGVSMTMLTQLMPHPYWRLFLVVGILGGYTTFSSFEWETFFAARNGSPLTGLIYVLSSVTVGYLAVWLGAILVRR